MAPPPSFAAAPVEAIRRVHPSNRPLRQSRPPSRPRRAAPARCSAATGLAADLRKVIADVAGAERGLFVLQRASRERLDEQIRALESSCPTPTPTADAAAAAAGRWSLLYTTLTILGSRRTKLAIATESKPGFVRIADITQAIHPEGMRSVNEVRFNLLAGGKGSFTLDARYSVAGPRRVEVELTGTALKPEKLAQVLGENVALLTEIFNPQGFLDITYLDGQLRVGRDHNGHVFVLEKVGDEGADG